VTVNDLACSRVRALFCTITMYLRLGFKESARVAFHEAEALLEQQVQSPTDFLPLMLQAQRLERQVFLPDV
jgi:hypothetical protein